MRLSNLEILQHNRNLIKNFRSIQANVTVSENISITECIKNVIIVAKTMIVNHMGIYNC